MNWLAWLMNLKFGGHVPSTIAHPVRVLHAAIHFPGATKAHIQRPGATKAHIQQPGSTEAAVLK